MIGKTISHYKILEKLGEGGMGIVYKAHDTKLDRFVALKFLPSNFEIKDEDQKRFLQEAKAAAAINHSNVCTIHDMQEHEGQKFIVMEHIEGQTLRLAIKDKRFEIEEAIDIAIQIGEALSAAHEKGIVHRDIKSDNIMITDSGQAKVMDFGLAKLRGSAKLTQHTSTLGTLAYMSPEQIESRPVDGRSDIFSFGIVLYEMLTGSLPFSGDYEASIMHSILNEEPKPLQESLPGVSSDLLHIIDRVLEKDPEDRYQTVKDMVIELKRFKKKDSSKIAQIKTPIQPETHLMQNISSEANDEKISVRLFNTRNIFYGIVIIALLTVVYLFFPIQGNQKTTIPASHTRITFTGKAHTPEISPDGTLIAYISSENPDLDKLIVQDVSGGKPLNVFSAQSTWDMRWTPDGSNISVTAKQDSIIRMYIIPRLGGENRVVKGFGYHAWSADGSKYAGAWIHRKQIRFIDKESAREDSRIYLAGDFNWIDAIDWSPINENLLFLTSKQEYPILWTIKSDGSNQQKILQDSVLIKSPRWSADGSSIYYLRIYLQSRDLMKISIDPATGSSIGMPHILQSGFQVGDKISLTLNNRKLVYTHETYSSNLKLLKKNEKKYEVRSLTTGTAMVVYPDFSPDGKSIVFSMGSGDIYNIYSVSVGGGTPKQLTFFRSHNTEPRWSPDGKEIAFISNEGGKFKIWKVSRTGGGLHQFKSTNPSNLEKWGPFEKILYQYSGNRNFHFLDPRTESESQLVPNDSVGYLFSPVYSPDKEKMAVFWNRAKKHGNKGIWLISLIDSSQILLKSGWLHPLQWSSDGKWIYAMYGEKPNKIVKINVTDGHEIHFYTLPFEGATSITSYSTIISPNGNMIATIEEKSQTDIWVMENFDPAVE